MCSNTLLPIILIMCCCGNGNSPVNDCACNAAMLLCLGALCAGFLCNCQDNNNINNNII